MADSIQDSVRLARAALKTAQRETNQLKLEVCRALKAVKELEREKRRELTREAWPKKDTDPVDTIVTELAQQTIHEEEDLPGMRSSLFVKRDTVDYSAASVQVGVRKH